MAKDAETRADLGDPCGTSADTGGYRKGTHGYPSHSEGGAEPESEKWWARYGYSSLEEYLAEGDRIWEEVTGRRSHRSTSELPTPALPAPAAPPAPRASGRKTRQLGLKLSERDYGELLSAAETFGVRPTTLARMLIRRGVRAITDEQHAV